MQSRWQDLYFKDVAVEIWKHAIPPEHTRLEVEFLEETFRQPKGEALLDICCGHGRHAIPLAEHGYRVTGIDSSEDALAEARTAAASTVNWQLRDMLDLPRESEFDGAYCFGNSFGYLDRDGLRQFLPAVARALRPGARFIIETGMTAESILRIDHPGQRWFRAGDIFMLNERRYDAAAGRLDIDYTFLHNGKVETRPTSSFTFTASEIIRLHADAGLKLVEMLASVQGEAYKLGSPRLILVTERGYD
jgi:SAM-dependent methyltransferase